MSKYVHIHIGKTGGSYFWRSFSALFQNSHCHLSKPRCDKNKIFVVTIRNPISRFVSAFNYSYVVAITDVSKIEIFDFTTSLNPGPHRKKKEKNLQYVYSPEYEKLLKYFETANNLAESLSSNDVDVRTKAHKLMNFREEHIFHGIGYYLHNGEFVKTMKNNLIVIRMEKMEEDIQKFIQKSNAVRTPITQKIRENKLSDKYLSELAIKNIINFYKNSDYAALNELYNANLIDKETLDSYYIYENITIK